MGTPAQIGKYQYGATIACARQANMNLRRILRRAMEESQSQLIKVLIGQAAMELSENDAALNELERIGKVLKDGKQKK